MVKFSIALEGDKSFEEYEALARLAEQRGFESLQIYEHIGFRPSWSALFHLATRTRRIRMGPVTVPVTLYHPGIVASSIACLNELTGGRAILGISRGALYERIGIKVEKPLARIKEAVEIVDHMLKLRHGPYKGRIYRISEDMRFYWRYRRSTIPIYIGTSGPKTVALAASLRAVRGIVTDNLWNPAYLRQIREWAVRAATLHGKDPGEIELIPRPFCTVAESRAEATKLALREMIRYLPHLVGNSPMLSYAGIGYKDIQRLEVGSEVPRSVAKSLVDNFCATGTWRDVVDQVEAMVKAGARHICFGHPLGKDPTTVIRQLGDQVIPRFSEE